MFCETMNKQCDGPPDSPAVDGQAMAEAAAETRRKVEAIADSWLGLASALRQAAVGRDTGLTVHWAFV